MGRCWDKILEELFGRYRAKAFFIELIGGSTSHTHPASISATALNRFWLQNTKKIVLCISKWARITLKEILNHQLLTSGHHPQMSRSLFSRALICIICAAFLNVIILSNQNVQIYLKWCKSILVFIGPESDHWLCLSVTHWLTHSLLFSKLDWCDPGVWRYQLKTCSYCYCC